VRLTVNTLACADLDGLFLTIDDGDFGRNSDGRVLKKKRIGARYLK
jgi:hypothetical protein